MLACAKRWEVRCKSRLVDSRWKNAVGRERQFLRTYCGCGGVNCHNRMMPQDDPIRYSEDVYSQCTSTPVSTSLSSLFSSSSPPTSSSSVSSHFNPKARPFNSGQPFSPNPIARKSIKPHTPISTSVPITIPQAANRSLSRIQSTEQHSPNRMIDLNEPHQFFDWLWDVQLECDRRGLHHYLYDCNLQFARSPTTMDFLPFVSLHSNYTTIERLPHQLEQYVTLPLLYDVTESLHLARVSTALEGGLILSITKFDHPTAGLGSRIYKVEETRHGRLSRELLDIPKALLKEQLRFYNQSQEVMSIMKRSLHPGFQCHVAEFNAPLLLIAKLFDTCIHHDALQILVTDKEREIEQLQIIMGLTHNSANLMLTASQLRSLKEFSNQFSDKE